MKLVRRKKPASGKLAHLLRQPTADELAAFQDLAISRIYEKHPQLRAPEGAPSSLVSDPMVDDLIVAMVVWMAEAPGWSAIP